MSVPTFLTNESIGPFELGKVVIASLIVRELLLKLKKGKAFVSFFYFLGITLIYNILKINEI